MKRWVASIFLMATVACGKKPSTRDDAAVATPDPCAIERAKLAPLLAKLGATPTTTPCGSGDHVWYDGTAARDRLLGGKPPPTALSALVGHWVHAGDGLDDDVDWRLAADGVLAVVRTAKSGKHEISREVPRQVTLLRDRQLQLATGSGADASKQFVPFFATADTLYASWTTGALAVPIASATADFVLPEPGPIDRWVIRHGATCELVDPHTGARSLDCAFDAGGFHYLVDSEVRTWNLVGTTLVDARMEKFTRAK